MSVVVEDTGRTHISSKKDKLNLVELKKLDDYEYNNVDFIKIDVEGFEN
jgi:hypothetical protein